MVRWIILCVLAVAVTAAATIGMQYVPEDTARPIAAARVEAEVGPPPKLMIAEPTTFNFGIMGENAERTKIWNVRNEGLGELRLTMIETSCTCTSVQFGADGEKLEPNSVTVIPPGESRELHFAWKPKDGTRGKSFSSNVRFATNDFDGQPSIAFGVEGEVTASVVVMPESLVLDGVSSEEPTTVSLALFSPSMPELQLTEPPSTGRPDKIDVVVTPLTPEQVADLGTIDPNMKVESGYQVAITVKPGMPLGRFSDNLVLKTNHPASPRLDVSIKGLVVGPISTTPPSVFLPGVSSKTGGQQVLTLSVRGQETTVFEISEPAELADVFDVSIEPIPDDATSTEAGGTFRQYRMVVKVPPGAKSGKFSGFITLKTDHPSAAEVKVPVTAFIQAG